MDTDFRERLQRNEDIYLKTISDICSKYSKIEDGGDEVNLTTMTYKTADGKVRQYGTAEERRLHSLQGIAKGNTAPDNMEDIDENEDKEHETAMDSHLGASFLECSRASSSSSSVLDLPLPEDQDPELEQTFSSQSEGPTLQDLYPGMISQFAGAFHRDWVSEGADAVRRKYQRHKAKQHLSSRPGFSSVNSSVCGSVTSRQVAAQPKQRRPPQQGTSAMPWRVPTGTPSHTVQTPGHRDSPRKHVNTQGPVLIMDSSLTTSPPSSDSSPDTSPDASLNSSINQTYLTRSPPPVSSGAQHQSSWQQGRTAAHSYSAAASHLHPDVGPVSSSSSSSSAAVVENRGLWLSRGDESSRHHSPAKASPLAQSATGPFVAGHYNPAAAAQRKHWEGPPGSSSFRVDALQNSPSNRGYRYGGYGGSTENYPSPRHQEETASTSWRYPHPQRGAMQEETGYSSSSAANQKASWRSPVRGGPIISIQQQQQQQSLNKNPTPPQTSSLQQPDLVRCSSRRDPVEAMHMHSSSASLSCPDVGMDMDASWCPSVVENRSPDKQRWWQPRSSSSSGVGGLQSNFPRHSPAKSSPAKPSGFYRLHSSPSKRPYSYSSSSSVQENRSPHKRWWPSSGGVGGGGGGCLQRSSSRRSPSRKSSPAKAAGYHGLHSSPSKSTRPPSSSSSVQPRRPESYRASSMHHHQSQKNGRPSPSHQRALHSSWSPSWRSSPSPSLHARQVAPSLASSSTTTAVPGSSPGRRLSNMQDINRQFQELYHRYICLKESVSDSPNLRSGSSTCLCAPSGVGVGVGLSSPTSRARLPLIHTNAAKTASSPGSTSGSSSRLAGLSLTPVRRRRRLHSERKTSLLRRVQTLRQESCPPGQLGGQPRNPIGGGGQPWPGCSPAHSSSSVRTDLDLKHFSLTPLSHHRLSKRRIPSESQHSPSLKRFREGVQSQSKARSDSAQSHHEPQYWGVEDDNEDEEEEEDAMATVENDPPKHYPEESRRRHSIALLLHHCPSPRLLMAARRLSRAGRGSRSGSPITSDWKRRLDNLKAKGGISVNSLSEGSSNESGISPSLSRRRLTYNGHQC
ncbi:mucin-6-like [Engraulis encrasicolus]|uniref:mucin-6-like n=1 Tax=Engraulis encrasicolus TaxID=184585 RepID=UPI002FD61201